MKISNWVYKYIQILKTELGFHLLLSHVSPNTCCFWKNCMWLNGRQEWLVAATLWHRRSPHWKLLGVRNRGEPWLLPGHSKDSCAGEVGDKRDYSHSQPSRSLVCSSDSLEKQATSDYSLTVLYLLNYLGSISKPATFLVFSSQMWHPLHKPPIS